MRLKARRDARRACTRLSPAALLLAGLLLAMPASARILLETLVLPSMIEDAAGRPVGLMTLPPDASGAAAPLPAVLLVHDMLGRDQRSDRYVEQLLGAGLAVLEVAGEPGEDDPDLLPRAYGALARHPMVDPARIGLLAFGEGARRALIATREEDPFVARVVLYPGCAALLREVPAPAAPSRGRLLIVHGLEDAANRAADCAVLAARLPGSAPSRLRSLPGASYAWDFPAAEPSSPWLHPEPGGAGRLRVRPWPALADLTAAEAASFLASMARPRILPASMPAAGMR